MPLYYTLDSQIRPQDLTLDFYLKATLPDGSRGSDFSGIDTYTIGAYTQNLGFGITNIEIDIAPNLQPVVNITFKDLYGNLVLGQNKEFNFDILFNLPYPKFELYLKGYLGNAVSYLLQVKKIVTTFQPSDGSYEIKAEFVPNIFGFFNDIPFQYLFAVKKLKEYYKEVANGEPNDSIVDIAKNGSEIAQKIEQKEEKYTKQIQALNLISTGGETLTNAYADGTFKAEKIIADDVPNFTAMTFNINLSAKPPTNAEFLGLFGDGIVASINSAEKIDFLNASWGPTTRRLSAQTETNKIIARQNLEVLSNASRQQATKEIEDKVIDSQTIYNVITRLAGDCAYILGFILEGGIEGFNGDSSRKTNNQIFGLYYPLIDQPINSTTSGVAEQTSVGEQIPYPQATPEKNKVEIFVKALYEGTQEAQATIDKIQSEQQGEGLGIDGGLGIGSITKPLTDFEVFCGNPFEGNNPDQFIVNLIQRVGVATYYVPENVRTDRINADTENFKTALQKMNEQDRGIVKKFLSNFKLVYNKATDNSLTFKNSNTGVATPVADNITWQKYVSTFLDAMKKPTGFDNKMFANDKPDSLKVKYMNHNRIMYWNPSSLGSESDSKNANNANFRNDAYEDGYLVYIKPDKLQLAPVNIEDDKEYGKYWEVKGDDIKDSDSKCFFRLSELNTDGFKQLKDIVGYYYKDNTDRNNTTTGANPKEVLEAGNATCFLRLEEGNDANYMIDFSDSDFLKSLGYYMTNLEVELNKTPAQIKKENEESGALGAGVDDPNNAVPEPYQRDEEQIKAVYTQFHHICNAWVSISDTSKFGNVPSDKKTLRTQLEAIYKSTDRSGFFYLNFDFPMKGEDETDIDVSKAIINTSSLLENNSETSTLNMMTNICTQNNFLLQPVPGGVGDNLPEAFMPKPDGCSSIGRNAFSIIWSPTPENRNNDNNQSPIYPKDGFLKNIEGIKSIVHAFQFGSPRNIIFKSVKAGTDDNKVTSESLQATSDIVNNQNQNKKKAFDCSMLAVIQGRSYKIGVDIIGNSQVYPTMLIGIDGLPIFTGLYWVMKVRHNITPNNMETSFDAMKMKYNGKNFTAIRPIFKENLRGTSTTTTTTESGGGGGNTSTTENIGGGDSLNTDLLTKVKDVKLKNPTDINNLIKQLTSSKYSDFPKWFNSEVKGKGLPLFPHSIDSAGWTDCWNNIIPVEWTKYGTNGINFLEFININTIIYNETGGTFKNKSEIMNPPTKKNNPGIAYAFDRIQGVKRSYNTGEGSANKTAFELFNDPNFIATHKSKKYGSFNKVVNTREESWKSQSFPTSLFSDVADAVNPSSPTFINEADFFKFRGRGYIQTTWRGSYKKVLQFILDYNGNDTTIKKYRDRWKGAGYNGDQELILTKSSNQDWDDIFENSVIIRGKAMNIHASACKDYQYIEPLTKPKDQLSQAVFYTAKRISGSSDPNGYPGKHQTRVFSQLDILNPSGASKPTNNGMVESNKPVPEQGTSPNAVWDKVTEGRIKTLHPKVRDAARSFINEAFQKGFKIRISQGLRTFAEQQALYDQGRSKPGNKVTNAAAGDSNHNYGLAIDIVFIGPNGEAIFDGGIWEKPNLNGVVDIAKKYGFLWGGDWKSFKDKPHFEMMFGLSLKQIKNIYAERKLKDGYVII